MEPTPTRAAQVRWLNTLVRLLWRNVNAAASDLVHAQADGLLQARRTLPPHRRGARGAARHRFVSSPAGRASPGRHPPPYAPPVA